MGPGIHIRYAKQVLGGLVVLLLIVAGCIMLIEKNGSADAAEENAAVVETVEGEQTAAG